MRAQSAKRLISPNKTNDGNAKATAEEKDWLPQNLIGNYAKETKQLDALLRYVCDDLEPEDHQEQVDTILDRMGEIGTLAAEEKSQSLNDVAAKIGIWRLLAPEDALNIDTATTDERLMISIVEEITKMLS